MATSMPPAVAPEPPTPLREIAWLFLRLGTTAFGGPAAHIALMHDEVVRRRAWLNETRFLDLMGIANLIPGPNSTEMAMFIGWDRRRWKGLVVAGCAFIFPAMLISAVLGHVYVKYHSLPFVGQFLYGVKPVMLAVVLQAIWGLLPRAARTPQLAALGGVALLGAALGLDEISLLIGAGIIAVTLDRTGLSAPHDKRRDKLTQGLALAGPVTAAAVVASQVTLSGIFWTFLKIGSFLFGSGYVLLAFLRTELVIRLSWLTEPQLLDAIAVGQVTPGPVFSTATFIGYLLAGPRGALAATAGIFLPAFCFVAISGPILNWLRSSRVATAAIDGVNVASLALMTVVSFRLGRTAVVDWATLMLAVVAALLLIRWKLNATWLILGGATAGWIIHVQL